MKIFKLFKPAALLLAAAAAITLPTILIAGADAAALPAATVEFSRPPEPVGHYTLRSYGKGVGVFSDNDSFEPVYFAEIDVGSLRTVDREMFETGVTVESWEDVLRLLEDFIS